MTRTVFVRSPYNYDVESVSDETGLKCEDESRTIQSAAEDADINTIVRRFGLTGQLPTDLAIPQSGDFTNIPDFHTAMNLVRQAQEEFMRVPAEIRERFSNDPQRLMSFVEDDANRDEALKLGLLKPVEVKPEPQVLDVRVVAGDVPAKS
ncbi:MAG: internal scaffolding protein [Microviridae sp.]|nr:MAG: internal scaffolding protein [Microviridae sp.]